ncbi:hypothetical protein [Bacteroides heparinolyticus]|uniref:hypothetical protein n=1 Tax=Prevotella heparinolytica TaxID=28113 RepID=UPI0035A1AEDF
MDKKFYVLVLGLLILTTIKPADGLCQGSRNAIMLEAHLSADTCSFNSSAFEIAVAITNGGLLPRTVYTNRCISENVVHEGVGEGELFLIVTHKSVEYRYYESVILYKHGLPKKHFLWFSPIRCRGVFYMSRFLKERHRKPNVDYGSYSIRAALVVAPNDTLFSNPVTINYVE